MDPTRPRTRALPVRERVKPLAPELARPTSHVPALPFPVQRLSLELGDMFNP